MANKKKTDKATKNVMLRVRVTADEREMFSKLAEEKGYRSVSDYIRSLVADEEDSDDEPNV